MLLKRPRGTKQTNLSTQGSANTANSMELSRNTIHIGGKSSISLVTGPRHLYSKFAWVVLGRSAANRTFLFACKVGQYAGHVFFIWLTVTWIIMFSLSDQNQSPLLVDSAPKQTWNTDIPCHSICDMITRSLTAKMLIASIARVNYSQSVYYISLVLVYSCLLKHDLLFVSGESHIATQESESTGRPDQERATEKVRETIAQSKMSDSLHR